MDTGTESAKVASGSGLGPHSREGGGGGSENTSGGGGGGESGRGKGIWDEEQPPPLVSLPRFTTLFASLIVALSSGTNYVRILAFLAFWFFGMWFRAGCGFWRVVGAWLDSPGWVTVGLRLGPVLRS